MVAELGLIHQTPISSATSEMAATNAADVPVPGDQAPRVSDTQHFMAMMLEGQRMQSLQQQQQHQQFLQVMQHFADNVAGGHVPAGHGFRQGDGGPVPSVKQYLDEICFRRINKFDNKESSYGESISKQQSGSLPQNSTD